MINLERYHYIALVGWISKIFTVLFSLINTRLLLDILNIDGFAVYSIVFSLAGWISLLNFAIPSAVQNTISKFRVKKQELNELFKTVLFMIITIILLAIPLLYGAANILLNTILLEYKDLLNTDYFFIMLFLLLLFGLSEIFNKILFAINKGYWPNIYPAITSILGFVSLYILKNKEIHDVNIVLIVFFLPYLFIFIISYIQSVGFIRPRFNKEIFLIVFNLMKKFFLFAILAAFVLKVDYIIMSIVLEAKDIVIYNLDMRIFNLILFMYGTILAALWPVSAELFHKKKFDIIKSNVKKNIIAGILISVVLSSGILFFRDEILLLISGKDTLMLPMMTGVLTAFYIVLRIWTDSYATILQSMNEVKILIYVVPFQALISIVAQYTLGMYYGLNGIIMGLCLSFLLTVVWVLPLKFYKITRVNHE